jgi:hypothetical protein
MKFSRLLACNLHPKGRKHSCVTLYHGLAACLQLVLGPMQRPGVVAAPRRGAYTCLGRVAGLQRLPSGGGLVRGVVQQRVAVQVRGDMVLLQGCRDAYRDRRPYRKLQDAHVALTSVWLRLGVSDSYIQGLRTLDLVVQHKHVARTMLLTAQSHCTTARPLQRCLLTRRWLCCVLLPTIQAMSVNQEPLRCTAAPLPDRWAYFVRLGALEEHAAALSHLTASSPDASSMPKEVLTAWRQIQDAAQAVQQLWRAWWISLRPALEAAAAAGCCGRF